MDMWHIKAKRDHILIMQVHAPVKEVEETPRKHRRAAGDTLVVGYQGGVFREGIITRCDCHVATDAWRRLTRTHRKWELDVHLNRFTAWSMFFDPAKARAAWRRLSAGGRLPGIAHVPGTAVADICPHFPPRIVTSKLLLFGAFAAAADAYWGDVAALKATGITVARDPMDDHGREQLWVPDLIPEAATMAKLASALDTFERGADPHERERCRLMREALNNTRRNR
jgi:hypothetical protein